MSAEIHWIHHASFRLTADQTVVYIDPWKLPPAAPQAGIIFVSHSHFDHCSADDVARIASPQTKVIAPSDTAGELPAAEAVSPGKEITIDGVVIQAVPAYNIGKHYHPKANHWLGAVFALGGVRIYYAGDTDRIPEMKELADIGVALLPVGGTYTMNSQEAAAACADIGCKTAVPYHWGDIVGTESDARAFAEAAACDVHILRAGESMTV